LGTGSIGAVSFAIPMAGAETIHIAFVRHSAADPLSADDRALIAEAVRVSRNAYAPYSRFHVGAALRMDDGSVVAGSNQENASFPAGCCAERTALHAAMAQQPGGRVIAMAVAVPDARLAGPVPPCGICRQALAEQEHRQGMPVRLLLAAADGTVLEFARAGDLLPLSFDASYLARP
jgi:cytidine deaminase